MPAYFYLLTAFLLTINSCTNQSNSNTFSVPQQNSYTTRKTIRGISLPKNFSYIKNNDAAYSNWLLDIALKENNMVFLYNGLLKPNQNPQFAVLDIDIGKKDLVQCADAAIKLRGDFLFSKQRYNDLVFISTSGDSLSFIKWLNGIRWNAQGSKLVAYKITRRNIDTVDEYDNYMQLVFSYCGSYSLSKQLKTVKDPMTIMPGDIFIKGGFPGHAVTVMAVAKNDNGEKIFLLSQGFMPAQDIHILKNYSDTELSPWYSVKDIYPLYTPQWQFEKCSLNRW